MINNEDKINDIEKRIEAIQIQIDFLENAILSNPEWNEPDKPTRESVLNEYTLRRDALINLKYTLTQ